MIQALTLILAGMQLLIAIQSSPVPVPEPLFTLASTTAHTAIRIGNEEYAKALVNPTGTVPTTDVNPVVQPQQQTAPTQTQTQTLITTEPKKSMSSIKIISPIAGKGLGSRIDSTTGKDVGFRVSPTYPELQDETNYIELGLVCRDDDGKVDFDSTVEVVSTDSTQNKTMNGTGNVTKIYNNGVPESVNYYPFHYEFKTAGKHTITFTCNGLSESVDIQVSEVAPE